MNENAIKVIKILSLCSKNQRKINKKGVSGHKRSSQRTTSVPRKTYPHSQPTQQLPTSKTKPKGRMYMIVQRTITYVRD